MSSKYVRESIVDFLTTNTTEKVVDLTAEFLELDKFLLAQGVADQEPWLGVQFLGSQEIPVDIRGTNTKGTYRETGVIYLHVVAMAKMGAHVGILDRAEDLRNLLRGIRVANTVLIEAVSPVNFGDGITLNFEGGYTAGLIQIDYQKDLNL